MIFRASICAIACFVIVAMLPTASAARTRPIQCPNCTEWNQPQTPFRIYGNTYYVGPHGLSAILITSDGGHILIDGALPQSAQQIVANVRSLGFRIEDVKLILNSHVHYDHAGGIAELQRLSGARVLVSPWSAGVMKSGVPGRGDPQRVGGKKIALVRNIEELHDGERVTVGPLTVTAHFTPGHTPGGTSWTWKSCETSLCRDVVYADSLSPVSGKGFRFTDSREYPQVLADFEKSFRFLETIPCDILVTTHPDASGLWDRLEAREKGKAPDAMVSTDACRQLEGTSRERLRQRLAEEQKK